MYIVYVNNFNSISIICVDIDLAGVSICFIESVCCIQQEKSHFNMNSVMESLESIPECQPIPGHNHTPTVLTYYEQFRDVKQPTMHVFEQMEETSVCVLHTVHTGPRQESVPQIIILT